jgi:hypothetical protein
VLREAITDGQIRALPLTGAGGQFIDSTDAIGNQHLVRTAVAAQPADPGRA